MERMTLNAELRDTAGKGIARSLRRAGQIPAVVYREGKSSPIKLNMKEMKSFMKATKGEQTLVNLKFSDSENKLALLKDYQLDPVAGSMLHADFFEVSLTEEVKTMVHVVVKGEPIGVKRDSGIMQYGIREIEIECLPDKIPGHVEYDVTEFTIGQSLHVSDIKFEEGIKVLNDPKDVIISIVAPVVEAAAPTEAEAAATAEAEGAEPEVAKKGKKEEEKAEEKS